MTSQKDQIQALITEIDGVLQKTTPRLPWVVSGEMTQQRQVLERVRNYLVALQRRQIAGEGFGQAGARPDLLAHDIYYQPAQPYPSTQEESPSGQRLYGQDELNAQQMLQAVVHEMGYLRTNLMQPLQADLEVLRQQRETLAHEIRQLEAQRQGNAGQLPGQQQLIAEFLQALMSRLQETLPQQLAQTLSSNQQALPYVNPYATNLALAGSAPSVIATSNAPSQGLGNIQVSQAPADELLIRLDSTLSVVFESLQRNVQSYQESLSQGLDKMHSMGQQGEVMFTALISHLAEQLGRETSAYLQPSAPLDRESARSSPAIGAPTSTPLPPQPPMPTVNPSLFSPSAAADSPLPFTLPFPGTEVADHAASANTPASTNVPAPSVDLAIDSWLRSAASTPSDVDLEIAALHLEGFDLSQLAAQDVNALLELDATLIGTNLPSQPLLSPTAPSDPTTVPDATAVEDTADIDAALKLLEQLSSELQEQPSSVANADAEIDRMLSSPTAWAGDASTSGIPNDARDELDEFYESLFGTATIATPTQAAANATETAPQSGSVPVNQPVIAPEAAIAPADQPETQPISTLPAETQMPTGALAAIALATPSASTMADPTLGWHLPPAPLAVSPAAEPEIPESLLEDELLGGWDFADAEVDLSEPVATTTTTDLLGGWDLAPIDRASLPSNAPPVPATDAFSAADALPATDPLAAFFDESQPSATAISPDVSPDVLPFVAAPADDQTETSPNENQDEISALTDLFGDPALGETPLAAVLPESAIAEAPAPTPDQPPFSLPDLAPDASPAPMPTADLAPVNLADGYLTDDRYAPASPDEDLLPLDEPIEALDSELWLDETTLNRLSEDLFNLEESIGEPETQLYSSEPDADSQALFPDTAAFADTFADPIAPSEPAPTASETTLGGWGDASLDDFEFNEVAPDEATPGEAAALLPATHSVLFPLESESRAIAADPPGTFILEGMDDLFANTPVAPPVTPIPPPVAPAEPSVPFALEGMDDLFADRLVSDQAVVDSTPAELPFTLEGVDELFADDPVVNPISISLPSASTLAAEPSFTLEQADDLFVDDPVVSPASLPSASAPPAELPFTLEGVDELFADDPVVGTGSLPSALTPAADSPLSFTLEGVDELFADLPPVIATPPVLDASPAILPVADGLAAEPSATLLFDDIASPEPIQPDPVTAFTLEQVGNLFVELPAAESSARDDGSATTIASTPNPSTGDTASPAPFTFEQVGDLFMEVPSEASTLDEQAAALTALLEPAPFAVEPVGNVFVETIAETTPAAPAEAPLPTPQPAASEPSALEQAFASLMGAFDEQDASPAVPETTEATTQAPEKKKEMS